jgi:hypothetical protein
MMLNVPVCCGASVAIGTSLRSPHCSDGGRYRTNNGQRSTLALNKYAANDPKRSK